MKCRLNLTQTLSLKLDLNLEIRGREPMAREPDVALLMTVSDSLDIFLTRLLQMKLFCNFPSI